MNIQLDTEEQGILDSVEMCEWQSVPNLQQECDRYQRHPQAYMQSIQKITIKLPNSDIESLQKMARSSGVSIPLLLSSIIQKHLDLN
jgi:predicted DNA binding CopG/RHH family protein